VAKKEPVKTDDLMLYRNQVRVFINNLKTPEAFLNAPQNTEFAIIIYNKAIDFFGEEEIEENVSDFGEDDPPALTSRTGQQLCFQRTKEILDSMTTLLAYLDFHFGDPIAMELFTDTLSQAQEVLNQGMSICSILLCRITLEQSLRKLCERNNIAIEPKEKAKSLNDKLRKPDGVFEPHLSTEIESKLQFENQVIHNKTTPTKEEAQKYIDWTEAFIKKYIEGN
jgi:hypothetical protein